MGVVAGTGGFGTEGIGGFEEIGGFGAGETGAAIPVPGAFKGTGLGATRGTAFKGGSGGLASLGVGGDGGLGSKIGLSGGSCGGFSSRKPNVGFSMGSSVSIFLPVPSGSLDMGGWLGTEVFVGGDFSARRAGPLADSGFTTFNPIEEGVVRGKPGL